MSRRKRKPRKPTQSARVAPAPPARHPPTAARREAGIREDPGVGPPEGQPGEGATQPPGVSTTGGDGRRGARPAAPQPHRKGGRFVPRVVSLIILVAVVLLVAAISFRVMAQFVAPLFLAGVLVVVFEPVHKRVMRRLPDRPQWSAAITTALIALCVLLPITWLGLNAYIEVAAVVKPFLKQAAVSGGGPTEPVDALIAGIRARDGDKGWIHWYETTLNQDFGEQLHALAGQSAEGLLATGLHTLVSAAGFLFGLGIMAFALYYFLADGPAMVEEFVRLSPLDDAYERQLLERFAEVSRAVVSATLVSAAAQGLLAGVGYYVVLDGGPVFLLTAVTMLMAIVPFVGATIVWAPVAAWVWLVQGDSAWAIALLLWGAVAVSNIDNLIKPMILHGQSNLHPLLALLSVLGGATVLGPVGILVGPMLVAFLQTLLGMLKKELDGFHTQPPSPREEGAAPP